MNARLLIPTLTITGFLILPAPAQDRPTPKKKAKPAPQAVEVDPFAADPFAAPKGKAAPKLSPEEQRAQLPKLVQVQIEWIEMPHGKVTELMFLREPKGDSTGLRKEVQELVANGEAEIIETAICLSRPGQRATTESVREHIYPTEFQPASLPAELEIKASKGQPDAASLSQLVTPPAPTAFETRNVGTTFEIEPNIGMDDDLIDLRFSPEIVIPTGEAIWQTVKDGLGNENHIQMPFFYSMRMSTGLTMRNGQYRFAGLLTPEGEDGESDRTRKVMVFVKCDVVAIGEETIKR